MNFRFNLAVVLIGLFAAGSANAVLIVGGANDGTDVGAIDVIVGAADSLSPCGPGGSPSVEECWAEGLLGGTDLTFSTKTETVDVNFTDTAGVIAFSLATGPGYYIVKNATVSVLMENLASTAWGVLDTTSAALAGLRLNLGGTDQLTISHVTEFDGGTVVPEPGALTMLGLGLLGLGLARRRRA